MPLMLAMLIELLEILSILLVAPQKEKVDMSAIPAITKTNVRLVLLEKKPFAKLSCVKHLLSKCNQTDGENYKQNVKLSNYEASFDSLSHKKNNFLDAVKSSITE